MREFHMTIAHCQGFRPADDQHQLYDDSGRLARMLSGFRNSLERH